MKILQNKDLGHQVSREATTNDIATAQSVLEFFNKNNGNFEGNLKTAFALSHNQVESNDPTRFFVVATDLVEKPEKKEDDDTRTDANWYFEDQLIFNPQIIEALPVFLNEVENPDTGVKKSVAASNIFRPMDACMSYPYRKPKKVDRFLKITVKYQVAIDGNLVDREEQVEGLKAHIFQHEVDHHNGIDIHFGDGKRKEIPIAEKYVGTSDTVLPDTQQDEDISQGDNLAEGS